jgi:hypothetical protein
MLPAAAYFALHFLLYILVLRRLGAFRREKVIFFYHAGPAICLAACAAAAVVLRPSADRLAGAALVVSLQGIYSLSFLELWSLAQGGYSLSILNYFESARRAGRPGDPADLEAIGESKKSDRLAALERLSLVQPTGPRYALTRRGRVVSTVLRGVTRLANLKDVG